MKVPARGDASIRLTWLVTGLTPYTEYLFNVSALLGGEVAGAAAHRRVRTRAGKPYRVEQPVVLFAADDRDSGTVTLRLGNASERHGPVLKYWLVVVPVGGVGTASGSGRAADAEAVNDRAAALFRLDQQLGFQGRIDNVGDKALRADPVEINQEILEKLPA